MKALLWSLLALVASYPIAAVSAPPRVTSISFFSAQANGTAALGQIWNTRTDPVWVLGVIAGNDPAAPLLNAADTSVDITLEGAQDFTLLGNQNNFVPVFTIPGQHFGLNLFFDGSNTPGISAIGQLGTSMLVPNSSASTRGAGVDIVPGAGTLTYTAPNGDTVQLSSLSIPGFIGIDRVGPGEIMVPSFGPDGVVRIRLATVVAATIEIMPDSPGPAPINLRSQGRTPVAILSSATFDAADVDPESVLFGKTGTEAAPLHYALEDVNGDGLPDLVLHFATRDTGIQCGDTSALLTGTLGGGGTFSGSDSIRTVGCK